MTEETTIHLVRDEGKGGKPVTVWCGRFSGVNIDGLDYVNPKTRTKFRAVHPENTAIGTTCGACRRSVGMLRTATISKDVAKGQRYKTRKHNG